MPARMWKHGIHSFLKLLRQRIPDILDYMLAFIYLAYQMMALLYETVPDFGDIWLECLGDLGRYRIAIEDEDLEDHQIRTSIAYTWHSNAVGRDPVVGRLYHHRAILAFPNASKQLFYYTESPKCILPFPSTPQAITTLFDLLIKQIPLEPDVLPCQNLLHQLEDHIVQHDMTIDDKHIDFLNQVVQFEPQEVIHCPIHNTRPESQWLGASLQKLLSWLPQPLKSGSSRFSTTLWSNKILILGLLVQKVTAASSTQPPSAGASTGSQPPSLGPLLVDKTPFDYVMYGIVAIYFAGACLTGPLVRRFLGRDAAHRVHDMFKYCSLALTTAMAFVWIALMGDELAAGIYISVVKIWAVTTMHFVVRDCSEATNRTLHIVTFLGLAIVFGFVGLAMQSATPSALKVLPPSLTMAAIINWAAYMHANRSTLTAERVPLADAEQGAQQPLGTNDSFPGDDPKAISFEHWPPRQQTGLINSGNQLKLRSSINAAEDQVFPNTVSSGTNAMINRIEPSSHGHEPGTVHGSDRPDHNARHQQDRPEDARFAVGDGFDDVSLHHE